MGAAGGGQTKPACTYIRTTIVSRVSAHGRLNITRDFGPHGRLPGSGHLPGSLQYFYIMQLMPD